MKEPITELALCYRRVSTDKQDTSIEAQERRMESYLALRGLDCPAPLNISDPDTSGRIPFREREGGRRAMDLLEHGFQGRAVRHLIVTKVDRLGRKASDMLRLLEWMQDRGACLHVVDFLGEPVTNQGIVGKVMFGMVALFAEMEVERIRERINEGFAERRLQHRITSGTVPYGMRLVLPDGTDALAVVDAAGRKRWPGEARLTEDPAEMLWKRQIHTWAAGGMPLANIARALNHAGVTTKTGKEWARSSVARILERELPAETSNQQSAISKAA